MKIIFLKKAYKNVFLQNIDNINFWTLL